MKKKEFRVLNFKFQSSKPGFSIGEVLLAVFVIGVSLVTIATLMGKSIASSIDSRDNIIASQLAQEGVELVRNIRDNNWVNGAGSFDNIANGENDNCRIDINSVSLPSSECNLGNSYKILYLKNGYYMHDDTGVATKFKRKIQLNDTSGNLVVASIVVWGDLISLDTADVSDCITANKCAYAQSILTKWGE